MRNAAFTFLGCIFGIMIFTGITQAQTGISGVKFNDLNANGLRDIGELGLDNWTIKAQPDSSTPNPNPIFVTTNTAGEYSFTSLPDGHYFVSEVPQSGWYQSAPPGGGYNVQITSGVGAADLDFGNTQSALPGSIYGYKFHDINGNGMRDSTVGQTEPLLDGWTIQISGPVNESAVTANGGYFTFSNLPPGVYTVSEVPKPSWDQTFPSNQGTHTVNLGSEQNVFVSFGNSGTNSIEGKKFNDENNNCSQDLPDEYGLPGWTIRLVPGPFYAITNADGEYKFASLGAGTYTIAEDLNNFWGQTCPVPPPGTYTVTLTSGQAITGLDFVNHVVQNVQDLAVSVGTYFPPPLQTPCCGQEMTYQISYSNLGSVAVSGATIEVHLSTHAEYLPPTVSNPPVNLLSGPNPLVYELPSPLIPGASGTIHVTVQLTCDVQETPMIVTHVRIEPFDDVQQNNNNIIDAMDQVSCSYDPNDKAVSPPGCGVEGYITKDDVLTYTIRFQNLGSGPAFQVVIRDVLNSNLDIGTVTNLGSSHPNVFEVNGNELIWTFPGIELPPASIDEPGSHGYIKFRVNQMPNNPDGTLIENLAAIYFDLNDPVLTNTTVNTITNNPLPVASFTITPVNASSPCTYSFTYTGGTTGASFLWDFGSGALPQTSTDQNPANVTYTQSGLKVITLQVTLGSCVTEPAVETLTVLDNIPPIITVSAPIDLWPPNHKYVTVNIEQCITAVTDDCAGSISVSDVEITSVSSDEPDDVLGNGDGNTVNDIVIASDCKSVQLRAERQGAGNGRVYTINVMVSDPSGNIGTAVCKVTVPHSRNGDPAVDDGVVYTVNGSRGGFAKISNEENNLTQTMQIPESYELVQNFPNPFNPTTTIRYGISRSVNVKLTIYDISGSKIITLVDKQQLAGWYNLQWNSVNGKGQSVSSGIYLMRLEAGDFVDTKKVILMK